MCERARKRTLRARASVTRNSDPLEIKSLDLVYVKWWCKKAKTRLTQKFKNKNVTCWLLVKRHQIIKQTIKNNHRYCVTGNKSNDTAHILCSAQTHRTLNICVLLADKMYIILGNFRKKLNRESSAIRQAYRAELGWNEPVTSVSGLFRNLCGRECVWVGFQQVYYLLWDGN